MIVSAIPLSCWTYAMTTILVVLLFCRVVLSKSIIDDLRYHEASQKEAFPHLKKGVQAEAAGLSSACRKRICKPGLMVTLLITDYKSCLETDNVKRI